MPPKTLGQSTSKVGVHFFRSTDDTTTVQPLVLRLFPTVNIVPHAELQRNALIAKINAIIQRVLDTLPPDSEQRQIFIDWQKRIINNPLSNTSQRRKAVTDLEWLLYEQIETQAELRIVIDERDFTDITQVLMGTREKALALRATYRLGSQKLLRGKITAQTQQQYQELISQLFYETTQEASVALERERQAVVAEGVKTHEICEKTATQIHIATMMAVDKVEDYQQEVAARLNECLALEQTRQSTLDGLEKIVKGAP